MSALFQMDFRSILIWFLLGLLESMYWSDVQPASEDLHGHQYMKLTIITAELASHHFPASGICFILMRMVCPSRQLWCGYHWIGLMQKATAAALGP